MTTSPEFPSGTMTADEFSRIEPQFCPVCGSRVDVDQVDVTPNAQYHAEHGRIYIVGMWRCPRGCNPQTGERYHGGYQARVDSDGPRTYTCTCGGEMRVQSNEDLAAFEARHPVGAFTA